MVLRFIFLFVYILNTLSLGGGLTFELEHLFLFLSLSELRGDLLNGAFSTPVSSIYFAFLATRFDPSVFFHQSTLPFLFFLFL